MRTLQVLIATMHNDDITGLCNQMNISSDALIINQDNDVKYECVRHENYLWECYTLNDRGLSNSRNNALMRSKGDIICLADDDMKYTDSYRQDIIMEFEKHPDADAIVFNVDLINGDREPYKINAFHRVGKRESRQYGSVHIAMRREKILYNNIFFNTMFGSGACYKCGEDTIFLKKFLDSGLKLYKSPIKIGSVDMSDSTWFKGYTKEYFYDKGAVIGATYPHIGEILVILQAFRNSKSKLGSYGKFRQLYDWYHQGLRDYYNKSR